MKKTKNRAVLISDIHYNHHTVSLADNSLSQAVTKAEELNVPLVIAGDLNDTKAIIRAECLNAILVTLSGCKVPVYVIVGNHDLINEKSKEHSLNFLKTLENVTVVDELIYSQPIDAYLIPYQTNVEDLKGILHEIPNGSDIIMHQGVLGAHMGEYIVDKSSIDPAELSAFRVISGHYHRRQTLVTDGRKHATHFEVGTFNYIGTPYSITHAEANDGPKGFRILTGTSLEFVPTNLRKHRKILCRYDEVMGPFDDLKPEDILWIQVSGPASELDKLSKKEIGMKLLGHQNFKLDKIYDEIEMMTSEETKVYTDDELLDKIIEDSEETKEQKKYLKQLWREVL